MIQRRKETKAERYGPSSKNCVLNPIMEKEGGGRYNDFRIPGVHVPRLKP